MHRYDFMTLYQLTLRVMTEGCLLTTKLVMIHFTRYDHHKLSEESQQYNDELYRRDPRHSPCLHAGCTLTRPSRPAWGRLAAIGKSRTVKWRQSSDQTGHSSHISDLCPRQSLPRPSVQIYNLESSSRLKMGAAIRRCFIQIRTLLY